MAIPDNSIQGVVSAQLRGLFHVYLPHSGATLSAVPGGALRRQDARENTALVTGDYVTLDHDGDAGGAAVILQRLPRKSLLTRQEAGTRGRSQPLCANADLLLLCTAMNEEFNLRRVERYLALADGAGIPALLVLTKLDTAPRPEEYLQQSQTLHPPRRVIACSAKTGEGMDSLRDALRGKTAALLGSSGVGKSSLINALLGAETLRVSHTSDFQDKGRHTTTARELLPLLGGYVIDTPGMRELRLDNADVNSAFADIAALAALCRFRDCAHGTEPGCAVRAAVLSGELDSKRAESFRKLKAEEARRGKRRA